MAVDINLHLHKSQAFVVTDATYENAQGKFVVVNVRIGEDNIKLFVRDLADIDTLAFTFENLARSLRDEHGWAEKENQS